MAARKKHHTERGLEPLVKPGGISCFAGLLWEGKELRFHGNAA
jgi:hypothetical protein